MFNRRSDSSARPRRGWRRIHVFAAFPAVAGVTLLGALLAPDTSAATLVPCSSNNTNNVQALINAITAANGGASGGVVTLSGGCTYTLTTVNNSVDDDNGLPAIEGNVTINGNGATIARSTAGGIPTFRLFIVDDTRTLTLNSLTLRNGVAPGTTSATPHGGGAVLNRGQLFVNGVTFINNTAPNPSGTGGGALDNHDSGQMTVNASTFISNSAIQGGAIEDEGTCPGAFLAVTNSTFTGNSTTNFGGGAIENQPIMGSVSCTQQAGGGHDTIAADTFISNQAIEGGAIANGGTMSVANSTLYGNTTNSSANGGGGIQNYGNLTLSWSTLDANSSPFGSNVHTAAPPSSSDILVPVTTVSSTIVANGGGGGTNCSGAYPITDGGHNLDSGVSCLFSNNALNSTNPDLAGLQWNGASTETMLPLAGSPVIDAAGSCSAISDQRGWARPQGSACDIGAVENAPDAYTMDAYGGVYHVGSTVPIAGPYWPGWKIARGLAMLPDHSGAGYVLDGWGGIHPFGGAPAFSASASWPGWDIARAIALEPDGLGGYVLDGYGGLHPFGDAPVVNGSASWPGWDIARALVLRPNGVGGYVLDGWGGLHPFGGAPALGASASWPGWDIARSVALTDNNGGYTLDGWGGVHPFGDASSIGNGAYWRGWDIARSISIYQPGAGYLIDGYGGVHPLGSAPGVPTSGHYTAGNDSGRSMVAAS